MSSKKARAKVFIEAANIIANTTEPKVPAMTWRPPACCNTLVKVTGSFRYDEPHHVLFKEMFKPDENEFDEYVNDYEASFWWGNTRDPENQMARTLALLFAAEMVKDTHRRKEYEKSETECP